MNIWLSIAHIINGNTKHTKAYCNFHIKIYQFYIGNYSTAQNQLLGLFQGGKFEDVSFHAVYNLDIMS